MARKKTQQRSQPRMPWDWDQPTWDRMLTRYKTPPTLAQMRAELAQWPALGGPLWAPGLELEAHDRLREKLAWRAEIEREELVALRPLAARGRKFPGGSTAGRRAWQRAVDDFAATRPQADRAALLQALCHGALADFVLVAPGKACKDNIPRKAPCAAGPHFHYHLDRDSVSQDQVLRYLRRLRPKPKPLRRP